MKSMTIIALCAACFSASTYANTFTDLFDGVTIGGGYASDSAEGSTLGGYSVYSQGTLFPSLKDYLFTDFRYTTTSKEDYWLDPSSNLIKQDVDLNRYQASLGLGYPFQVSESVVLKPYATAGWSWDKVEYSDAGSAANKKDNSFMASAGIRGEFGKHFVTGIGYSKETSGFKLGQWTFDVGYRF